ncbi:hypothetical protein Tco_1544434 [Tanacetum coccineum]
MTPSHSLTILSLSIKPQPNPPWLKEALLLVDVTCEREEMEGQDEKEKKDREDRGLESLFDWMAAETPRGFRAVGQLIAEKLRVDKLLGLAK